jgi:hypothetical protein
LCNLETNCVAYLAVKVAIYAGTFCHLGIS